ncbi:hypothetical protein J6590_051419 [Homalodisca vitripennis]|nr:hypothetical protein J6590_051419 [Homalodisca vitripennis]
MGRMFLSFTTHIQKGEFVLDFYLHGKTNGRRNAVNVEQNLVKFSVSMREDDESAIHVSSPDPQIELS